MCNRIHAAIVCTLTMLTLTACQDAPGQPDSTVTACWSDGPLTVSHDGSRTLEPCRLPDGHVARAGSRVTDGGGLITTSPAVPPCEHEWSAGPCYWDAATMGNGTGRSFIVSQDGTVSYLTGGK